MESSDKAAMAGVLVVDKPLGLSSMTVVSVVRRRAGRLRTGHAGTLDPLATGVLVLAIGRATKSIDRLMATDKRYHTTIDLSAFTATDDAEATREPVDVATPPDRDALERGLERFRGAILQRPPAYSAVKVGGRRAYRAARAGQTVTLDPRPVTVHRLTCLSYAWPIVELDIECAKGFYVRSLARELGETLGTGGTCLSIRRTAVGPFTIDEAIPLDDVPDPLGPDDWIPLDAALARVG